jgi:pSer/pThr/pTyr-binding forkhead associated (FHA) protein
VTIDKFPYVIGRKEGDFVLPDDPRMTRQHARITVSGNQFFIEDLDTTNHTFMAGEQLTPRQPTRLSSPARVRLGPDTEVEFQTL